MLGVIIRHYLLYFITQMVPHSGPLAVVLLTTCAPLIGLCRVLFLFVFVLGAPCFSATTKQVLLLLLISSPVLESAISPRNSDSFHRKAELETKVWALVGLNVCESRVMF